MPLASSRLVIAAFVAVALCLIGLGVYGQAQKRRAVRAETALAEARETLAARDVELDVAQADAASLRGRIEQQNAAVDDLAAAGQRQAARVAAGDVEARTLREIARTRLERILQTPAPTSCTDAMALLRGSVPQIAQEWAAP